LGETYEKSPQMFACLHILTLKKIKIQLSSFQQFFNGICNKKSIFSVILAQSQSDNINRMITIAKQGPPMLVELNKKSK
jgi:hypothetical protein